MLVLQAESLKADIQQEEITKGDADKLRDIEPKRKSVQNMLETEVAQAVCFDSQISEFNTINSKNKSPNTLFIHRMYDIVRYKEQFYLDCISKKRTVQIKTTNSIKL